MDETRNNNLANLLQGAEIAFKAIPAEDSGVNASLEMVLIPGQENHLQAGDIMRIVAALKAQGINITSSIGFRDEDLQSAQTGENYLYGALIRFGETAPETLEALIDSTSALGIVPSIIEGPESSINVINRAKSSPSLG